MNTLLTIRNVGVVVLGAIVVISVVYAAQCRSEANDELGTRAFRSSWRADDLRRSSWWALLAAVAAGYIMWRIW